MVTTVAAYQLLFRLKRFRFSWMMATGLLLGYVVGTLNTVARLSSEGLSIARYFARPQSDLSIAIAVSMTVPAALFWMGALIEKPIRIDIERLESFDLLMVWSGVAVVMAAFLTGNMGFMGVVSSEERRVTAIGSIAGALAPVLPALTVLLLPKCKTQFSRVISWLALAGTVTALVPQGRRSLLYGIILALLALNLRSSSPVKIRRILLVALLAAPVLYLGNSFFYAMRFSNTQAGGSSSNKIGLDQLSSRALQLMRGGRNTNLDYQVQRNLRDRTFIMRYFSDVLAASWSHQLLYGKALTYCIETAIPSAFSPDKSKVRDIGMEENLTNPQFGLPVRDEANSILTTGATDFGIVGVFVYPVAMSLLLSLFLQIATGPMPSIIMGRTPEALKAVAFLSIGAVILQAELSTSADFVTCRNILILFIPVVFLHKCGALFTHRSAAPRHGLDLPKPTPQRNIARPPEPDLSA